MMQIIVELTDPKFIRRATHQAAKEGRVDVKTWIQERMLRTARASLGLDADLSPTEVAQLLGVHLNTIHNYIKAGKFPHIYYRTKRTARIPLRDVKALTKKRTAA